MKKRWIIVILFIIFVLLGAILLIDKVMISKHIPYIAFASSRDRETRFYICSDGDIYISVSEESFFMEKSELIDKIRKNDYTDVLEYVGKTDARKVKEMHRLFSEVVLVWVVL